MSSETAYQGLLDLCTFLSLCDGYVPPKTTRNCNLEIVHSVNQLDYLNWKIDLLAENGIGCGKLYFRKDKKDVRVRTQRHEIFNIVRKRLYDGNGKKFLSASVSRRIEPLYLAIMFMDNGSSLLRRSTKENKYNLTGTRNESCISAMRLSMACFDISDVEKFKEIIYNKFKLKSEIVLDRKQYPCLYFYQKENVDTLISLIKDFFPKSMLYKIDHPTSLYEKLPEETERKNIVNDDATVQ